MAKTDKAEKPTPETAQADAGPWTRSDYLLADDDLTKGLPSCFWEAVGMHAYSKHDIQMARLISVAYENGFFGDAPFSLEPTDEGRKRFKELAETLQTSETGLNLILQIAEDKWGVMEGKMLRSIDAGHQLYNDSPGIAATKEEAATVDKEETDTDK